jgi:hypothetical protein
MKTESTEAKIMDVKPTRSKSTVEILCMADSKEDILVWGKQRDIWGPQHGGYCQIFEYKHGDNNAIVLLEDVGSGVTLHNIYIFGKSKDMKTWHLVLSCSTNTQVGLHQENDKLIFTDVRTDTNKIILELSLEIL